MLETSQLGHLRLASIPLDQRIEWAITIMNELEKKAAEHIAKTCGTVFKAAVAYRAFMQGVKLRMELEGWTPPAKSSAK
jgi:hypothetical protein